MNNFSSSLCCVVALFLSLGTVMSSSTPAPFSTPWKVLCRRGQPPINDFANVTNDCVGLFAELFTTIATRLKMQYQLTVVDSSVDPYLNLTSTDPHDAAITFQTITPDRMLLYDFSSAVLRSQDVIVLQPKYLQREGSITGSIIRDPVFYLFSIVTVSIGIVAIVFLVFESMEPQSAIHELPHHRRILWAMEMSFEAVCKKMTSERLYSQVSRSFSKAAALGVIFVLCIFSAVITSKLTASGILHDDVPLTALRGRTIGLSSDGLKPFLERFGMRIVTIPQYTLFAADFYAGKYPEIDGFATSVEVIRYLQNLYEGSRLGYTESEHFTVSGVYDLKAFPINRKRVPPADQRRFNLELERMRQDQTLALLFEKYLSYESDSDSGDIPLDATSELGLQVANGLVFGLALFGVVVLYFQKLFLGLVVAKEKTKHHVTTSTEPTTTQATNCADSVETLRVVTNGRLTFIRSLKSNSPQAMMTD
eukprot:PhF_6_TR37130/c0_g3_i5/m.54606